jgi:hypothetical protein
MNHCMPSDNTLVLHWGGCKCGLPTPKGRSVATNYVEGARRMSYVAYDVDYIREPYDTRTGERTKHRTTPYGLVK